MTPAPAAEPRRLFAPTAAANDGVFAARDWALFLTVAGVWGASFLLIDIGLEALPPGLITFVRIATGAAALAVLPKPAVRIERDDRPRVVVLSVLWTALPFTLFPIAEQYINSAVTGLLNGATPIFVAIVATVFVGRPPRGPLLIGILVGFAGIACISLPSIGDGASEAKGVLLVLAATVCYGVAINVAAPLQQRYGSLPLMSRMLALAALWTLPYGVWDLEEAEWSLAPLVAVLVLGVVGTGLAFAVMGSLVGRVGSQRASFVTYLIPVVSLVLGVAFRGDTVAPVAVVGIALVIGGALLASRARR